MTAHGLAALAKEDRRKVEDPLLDFMGKLHREEKSPGYMANYLKGVTLISLLAE
jgi:hypothetical protein